MSCISQTIRNINYFYSTINRYNRNIIVYNFTVYLNIYGKKEKNKMFDLWYAELICK